MQHFPIFVAVAGKRIVVSGAGECAVAKLKLILKTEAFVEVYGTEPAADVITWAKAGRLTHHNRAFGPGDGAEAVLFYGANDDPDEDARVAAIARSEGVLANIVDNLGASEFITPAIVDRDPVTVAIGTEGAAPVLARDVKRRVEEMLPPTLGRLARIGQAFRARANALPFGRARRAFWSDYYFGRGPWALADAGHEGAQDALEDIFQAHLHRDAKKGRVDIVGAGPGDPGLMTQRARTLLHGADVVLHDALVPDEILELARREATVICTGKRGFQPSMRQEEICDLMVTHAQDGAHVVRLKGGDPVVFARLDEEMAALDAAGIDWAIVPGITAASAAAAAARVSLTKRGRNGALNLLTAHDVKGFADQDWRALAAPGAVAAVYMGKRAAAFLRGRMMIAGADGAMPVTLVENASRADQRIFDTTLADLPGAVDPLDGPVVMLLGLAPRRAAKAIAQVEAEFA
ncbi:MAG: siroheme synthase CysG [Pseudomonadota bacterium]